MPRYLATIRMHRQDPAHPERNEYTGESFITFNAPDDTEAREKAREIARARAAVKTANQKLALARFGKLDQLHPWYGEYEEIWKEV